MRKSLIVRITVLLVFALLVSAVVTAQDKVQVVWFVGLGTGTNAEQIEAQNQVAADFNASQDEVELVLSIAASNETAPDALSTLVAAGQSPDIIGPVGVGGGNTFAGLWADLTPFVDSSGFDLGVFDPALVDLYRVNGELQGVPFLVFPSVTYFNTDLFDEAGLNYPPAEFGAPYVMPDGSEVEWNYDTVREIGMILTVDANGNDATMEGFDPNSIIQFGFNHQWARIRLSMTHFQPEDMYDPATNTVVIPESWRQASQWLQNAVWVDHFVPNTTYDGSSLLAGGGGAFSSGNLAMAVTPLWYTCCLSDSIDNFDWDMAVVPRSFDGEYHVATDADTFRMSNQSQNPEAAFAALAYLYTEGAATLSVAYGGYPAHPEYQSVYIDGKATQYPFVDNWDVVPASLAFNNPGNMHHEAFFPNWRKATDRHDQFNSLLYGETGADIDVNAELDSVAADMNAIINE